MSGTYIYVAGAIDFETTPTLSLTVRVTDSGGLSLTSSFTIAVTNVNERPTSVSLSNLAVNVSSCCRSLWFKFAWVDTCY